MAGMRAPGGKMSDLLPGAQPQQPDPQPQPQAPAPKPKLSLVDTLKATLDEMDYEQMCDAELYFEQSMDRAERDAIHKALKSMGGKGVVTFNNKNYRLTDDEVQEVKP